MVATCGVLPDGVNQIVNLRAKQYREEGLTSEQARIKAVSAVKDYLTTDTLGSTANPTQHPYTATAVTIIQNETDIRTIFNDLNTIGFNNKVDSITHERQLKHVVEDLVVPLANQLQGVVFVTQESNQATNPVGSYTADATNPRLDREIQLNISSIAHPYLNKFRLSFQEIAAHEFVHAITTAAYKSGNYVLRKGIQTLYKQAREALKPSDFSQTVNGVTTTAAEDQATYDYIFNNKQGNGPQEFMAFGLTNEVFRNALKKLQVQKTKKGATLLEKIEILFDKIVYFLTRSALHIKGDTVDVALENLVKELAGITKKQKSIVDYLSDGLELSKWAGSKTLDQIVRPLTRYAMSPNAPQAIQVPIAAWKAWKVFPKLFNFGQAIGTTVNNLVKHKEYFFYNLILKLPQELAGMNVTNKAWHDLLAHSKKIVDGARHKIKEATITHVRQAIGLMNDDDKRAMTSIIVMADLDDLQTYNPNFTFQDYRTVIDSTADREARINDLEGKLRKMFGHVGDAYIRQAHSLGLFTQTKQTYTDGYQAFNAYTIARGDWDQKFVRPANWQDAIPIIQQLKTLHSLNYATPQSRVAAVKFFDSQVNISIDDGNGFNNLLSLNVYFKAEALDKLFGGKQEFLMAGYTRDLNDPSVMVKFSSNPNDKDLIDRGFIRQEDPLGQSDLHSHPKNYLYVSNNNGLVPFNKMTASLTSKQLAGTSLTDLLVNEGWEYGNAAGEAKVESAVILSKINRKEMYSSVIDPKKKGSLFPVYDTSGNIVNHRYVMKEKSRIEVLKKDTRIDNVFGAMFESITDKVESVNINKDVVKELENEYKTMYSKKPKGFIVVTKNHPKYGEIYKLLPKEMKADLDAVFGEGRIVVREAMMDIIFGYRKYSLFTEGDNSWLSKMMKGIIIGLFKVTPGKYYRRGRATEQAWQEFVQELKTVIVLKTTVLGFNVLSNTIISFMHGLPLNYIFKKQGEAILAVEDYTNKYRNKLIYIQKLSTVGISAAAKANIQAKIVELEKDMSNSPILELIDAGLLNSIVEDVSLDDTEFGLKGDLSKFLASKTKWIPKPVKTVYEIGQIGPATGLYKLLEKTTRYSDFVARHAMYEWYTKEKGMSKEDALQIVTETFVNYDLPTSKELQYLNDMGAYMFTKYAVRIQKAIYRLVRDNPKSVVGLLVVQNMFGNVTDPTDSLDFFPGLPRNPINSIDAMFAPLYQLIVDIIG
jgi:hypothetical protein